MPATNGNAVHPRGGQRRETASEAARRRRGSEGGERGRVKRGCSQNARFADGWQSRPQSGKFRPQSVLIRPQSVQIRPQIHQNLGQFWPWRDKADLLIQPGLIQPGLPCSKFHPLPIALHARFVRKVARERSGFMPVGACVCSDLTWHSVHSNLQMFEWSSSKMSEM